MTHLLEYEDFLLEAEAAQEKIMTEIEKEKTDSRSFYERFADHLKKYKRIYKIIGTTAAAVCIVFFIQRTLKNSKNSPDKEFSRPIKNDPLSVQKRENDAKLADLDKRNQEHIDNLNAKYNAKHDADIKHDAEKLAKYKAECNKINDAGARDYALSVATRLELTRELNDLLDTEQSPERSEKMKELLIKLGDNYSSFSDRSTQRMKDLPNWNTM